MSEVEAETVPDAQAPRSGLYAEGLSSQRDDHGRRGRHRRQRARIAGASLGASSEAPAVDTGAAEGESAAAGLTEGEPLVAHVSDVRAGQISLFQGEREVVVRSPELARQIYLAAHS